MPIEFTREQLASCYTQLDALMHDYYKRTVAKNDVPQLDFDWLHYLALEQNKQIVLVTARNTVPSRDHLVGFVFYIITGHPQYRGTKMALCNTLAVRPEMRGMGIGRNLMAKAEDYLRLYEVDYILHMFRSVYEGATSPLFPKLGYEQHEIVYKKVLAR